MRERYSLPAIGSNPNGLAFGMGNGDNNHASLEETLEDDTQDRSPKRMITDIDYNQDYFNEFDISHYQQKQ